MGVRGIEVAGSQPCSHTLNLCHLLLQMEINESYDEVLDVLDALFVHMFKVPTGRGGGRR